MTRAAALVAALVALALATAGCGGDGDDSGSGRLRWAQDPSQVSPQTLPNDRILSGTVRNDSLEPIEISATDLRLVTSDGERSPASATFVSGYVHPLEPFNRPMPGGQMSESEQIRTGKLLKLDPGKESQLTVSWREPPGTAAPEQIDYGAGLLPIPES